MFITIYLVVSCVMGAIPLWVGKGKPFGERLEVAGRVSILWPFILYVCVILIAASIVEEAAGLAHTLLRPW